MPLLPIPCSMYRMSAVNQPIARQQVLRRAARRLRHRKHEVQLCFIVSRIDCGPVFAEPDHGHINDAVELTCVNDAVELTCVVFPAY